MKTMKLMFLILMMSGTLISISAYSWINIWIGLELNLLAFIPIMNLDNFKYSSESSLKYFLVQVSASILVLFSFLNSFILINSIEQLMPTSMFLFNSAILMKMGAAPFHFWYPEVLEGLSWANALLLMTWQKIAPMILIMYNFKLNLFFILIILMCMTLGSVKTWNQTSLKKILALSSINHIGWMLSMMMLNQSLWMLYFLIYTFISLNMILIFNKYKIFNIKDLMNNMNYNKTLKFYFFLNFFSLGGIPPFLGFFPKWLILKTLIENHFYFLSFMMIFITLICMYIYMRLMLQSLMMKLNENKKFNYINSYYVIFLNWVNIYGLIIFTVIFSIY
uniref:NADH-ubiquinone oxidoreductase chain 2 n=3 Tax=Harmonia axyridis TaxID=115357 RepID=A0A0U2D8Q7_HARAX|nr:NADH dehydrogenase subunit 2 [Harmonia axyridis]ARI43889.1 NADH dehydrogenase subunit 2 [Harmonia axyridis]